MRKDAHAQSIQTPREERTWARKERHCTAYEHNQSERYSKHARTPSPINPLTRMEVHGDDLYDLSKTRHHTHTHTRTHHLCCGLCDQPVLSLLLVPRAAVVAHRHLEVVHEERLPENPPAILTKHIPHHHPQDIAFQTRLRQRCPSTPTKPQHPIQRRETEARKHAHILTKPLTYASTHSLSKSMEMIGKAY